MADDYRVQLDIYNGPLDLLLYLIRREEVDVYDIPIARITEQYVGYVDMLQQIDPNVAGEFLVLAAMLMEIKSRLLLPRPPVENQEEFEDPRMELVRQLLEYKKFKDAANQLQAAAEQRSSRFHRHPPEVQSETDPQIELESLHVWDLVEAFRDVMAKTGRLVGHEVLYDDTPISLHATDIVDRLGRAGGSMVFGEVFEGRNRSECIGLFLALLELVRQRKIRADQETPASPIYVHLLDASPIDESMEEESPAAAGGPDSFAEAETPEESSEQAEDESEEPLPEVDYADDDLVVDDMPEVPDLPADWAGGRSDTPSRAEESDSSDDRPS
jgi:segregation and condensation protein A